MTPTTKMTSSLPLKIANVLAYLLFLGSSIYAVISPQPIYENIKQTYFTPTIWAFLVWPIIHILLLGTVIYQFVSTRGKVVVVDGISWELPLLNILYATFVTAWANHHHTAALVSAFLVGYINSNIYWTIKKEHPPQSAADELFIHLPFAVSEVWTVVTVYLTAFEAFGVDSTENPDGFWTKAFVFFALFTLECGVSRFVVSPVAGDRPAGLILSWVLWTISDNQRSSSFIHWSATVFFVMSLVPVLIAMDATYRSCTGRPNIFSHHAERDPLLGR